MANDAEDCRKVGHAGVFSPRWNALPPQFWDFLSIGVGGYIGGRTLEKVAREVIVPKGRR